MAWEWEPVEVEMRSGLVWETEKLGGFPMGALDDIHGVLIHAHNADDPEDQKYFWVYHFAMFNDWETLEAEVEAAIAGYGLEQ